MSQNYSKLLIKEYKYWSVYVHENQGYLGRCVIWCKRKNAHDLTDATREEEKELFIIIRALQDASMICFNPSWFNYTFLGNETRHLHGHFIPRYAKQKIFMGINFKDKLYGHNYKTDHGFVTSGALLLEVKTLLTKTLK